MLGHDDLKDSFLKFSLDLYGYQNSKSLAFSLSNPSLYVLKFYSFTYSWDINPDAYSKGEL